MTLWVKTQSGGVVKLRDRNWRAKIYAGGAGCDDPDYVLSKVRASNLIHSIKQVYKRESICDSEKSRVLEIELKEADKTRRAAELLERIFANPSTLFLYNVDVLPEQQYFYEKGLFPLAFVDAEVHGDQIEAWNLLDNVESFDYKTPRLKSLRLEARIADRVPKFDSKLVGLSLSLLDGSMGEMVFEGRDESEMISQAFRELDRIDPDLIVTRSGDSFVLPFLYGKARRFSLGLKINRDNEVEDFVLNQTAGKTYFSYGKIMYRPATQRLYGRLHLDEENTFIYDQCRLEGLFEVSRLCRIPLHTSMRASIGKCLSSLQFYYATKQDALIPWKPTIAEDFKSGYELLLADRGGLVLEPLPGIHEHIGEIDFASLYPSIISKYNISAETVNCSCCQNNTIDEDLELHICKKRDGIVAKSLELPLWKRAQYKALRDSATSREARQIFNERAASLKWILVCCLAKQSQVLIKQNGRIRYVEIGSFIDNIVGEKEGIIDCPGDISVAGVGHNLKSKFCKVQKLLKIPNQQRLLRITMDDGRSIIATPNHPFYLLKNGNLEVRQASELKKYDFIPVARKLPSSQLGEEPIDVIDQLMKSLDRSEIARWRVSGSILSQMILENKDVVLEQSMKEGYSNQAVRVWIRSGTIPLRFFHLLHIPFALRSKLRVGIGRVKGKRGITSWMPAVISVNEEFGFFLGLYVSDGSTTNTHIRLDIGYFELDLLENARKITESLFKISPRIYKEKDVNMYILQINNLAIAKFVERVLGLPHTSEKGKLRVPEIIFNSDKTVARGFLEGVLAGDGSVNKARNFASIATASKEFANQIGFLASILGLGFGISIHTGKSRNPLYTVNFVGPDTLREIAQWPLLKKDHYAILEPKLETLCNGNCIHAVYQLFPVGESKLVLLAREARTVRTPRIDQRDAVCPYRVTQTFDRINTNARKLSDKSINALQSTKRLFESDLGFVRIRRIEELDREDEYVYCFQLVDGGLPGFFAGEGAVFTHNCFGYLSYRNAKFGKIDSHIAVCALARKTLLEAMRLAEYRGFRVTHEIVDSLWLSKRKAKIADYAELAEEVREKTGFKLAIEGIYKWIVFLPSKMYPSNMVANRYFGCFEESNELKVRGIECRRHDSPQYFKKCQGEILQELSRCDSIPELEKTACTSGVEIFRKYAERLEQHDVSPIDLIIRRRLSKDLGAYASARQLSVSAASKLAGASLQLRAGQSVSYVITRYKSAGRDRAVPEELIEGAGYDSERYVKLLADCCATVLAPFGVTKASLLARSETILP